jgi:imidazole glycerol-phosphate synthase subunit HisH
MITIVDYGLGNILAFANVYKQLNIRVSVARTADDVRAATRLILPGVGAFDHAMALLDRSGMRQALDEAVTVRKLPVIGICVGMQILASSSEEGRLQGLGWIAGAVRKFDAARLAQATHLPHMGWNDVRPLASGGLFAGLEPDARFYFLHSYYFQCQRPEDELAVSDYGVRFACAVRHGNVYGVQFHPEKSHHYGVQLLKNFASI